MVINGETIVLQAQSVIDHVKHVSVPDTALSDKFPEWFSGPCWTRQLSTTMAIGLYVL